jgi:peptidoglycan/xylan/chitin deacetylase (PgdA/CDA1 family)
MKPSALRSLSRLVRCWPGPGQGGLPILMYHKVKPAALDPWTVTLIQLDRQFDYLKSASYQAITCRELIEHLNARAALPEKPILITFDDGYADNLLHACPLLERHGLRATMFLPVKFIGGENEWDGGGERLLDYDQLKSMSPDVIEFGLHSFAHGNYCRMSPGEIEADLRRGIAGLESRGLPFVRALAYPYGRSPLRRWGGRGAMRTLLKSLGIECGLRIGNRVNRLPIADRHALQRLDIRREGTLETFRRKLAE